MTRRPLEVPEAVRRSAEGCGEEGRQWLRDLDCLVGSLELDWDVSVGAPLHGGTAGYVLEATTGDGRQAVLKLGVPDGGDGDASLAAELRALLLAGGRGCVRVLSHDLDRLAMLQERLGPALATLGLPVSDQLAVICATLERLWRAPSSAGLRTGDDKARWLGEFVATAWEELDRPCSEAAVERAMVYAAARAAAFDPERAVLVHGDAHAWNALKDRSVGPGGFTLVDPEGLYSERAHDLGILMREWNGELLAGDAAALAVGRCHLLSRLTGVDPRPIWQWGFVERLSTGLYATSIGYEEVGRVFLAAADRLAGTDVSS